MTILLGGSLIVAGLILLLSPNIVGAEAANKAPFAKRFLPLKLVVITLGVFLLVVNSLFFYAEPGYSYLVQYITGQQISILTAGPKLKLFGRVIQFKKVMTVKFNDNLDGNVSGRGKSVMIRFNDAVTAQVDASIRFRIPTDPEHFRKMALDYRSQENLIVSSLIPVSREVIRNSGRMISAQEYIVGKGGEFEYAVLDQLKDGIYRLETQEIKSEREDAIVQEGNRKIESKETIKYTVHIMLDDEGNRMRKENPLVQYNIEVAQATIESVDPEQKFKDMIGQQRDTAAEANIERQKAKKAEYKKQRIIAEGETEKAREKVEREIEQVKALIKAETERKRQEEVVRMRKLELQAKKLESKSIKVIADAEAYKKQKIMQADGALELKLEALKEINKNYADAIKGAALVPEIVISSDGSGGGSSMDMVSLLTAKTARDLNLDMKPQK